METDIAEPRRTPLVGPAIRAAYDALQRRSTAPLPPFEAFVEVVQRELLPLLYEEAALSESERRARDEYRGMIAEANRILDEVEDSWATR